MRAVNVRSRFDAHWAQFCVACREMRTSVASRESTWSLGSHQEFRYDQNQRSIIADYRTEKILFQLSHINFRQSATVLVSK
jgi:hypothetical protein